MEAGTTKEMADREVGNGEEEEGKKGQVLPSGELVCCRSEPAENNGPYLRGTHTHTQDACSCCSRLNETKHLSRAPICLCQ